MATKPGIPTLPKAPAPYTPPPTPVVDPFAANIDMNSLITKAAEFLKPQFDQARTAETDRLGQEKVGIENDAIKRGWDRSIYTANRQQKAVTDSSKNMALIDSNAATAAAEQAKTDYDNEYGRQYAAYQDNKDNVWRAYTANLDAAKTAYENQYKLWQDTITNLWNQYNAQYSDYQSSRRGGSTSTDDPYAKWREEERKRLLQEEANKLKDRQTASWSITREQAARNAQLRRSGMMG